jgi:C4-dicarboxylate-specific signal transduction histidine kinase
MKSLNKTEASSNLGHELLKMAHDIRSPISAILSILDAPGDFCEKRKTLTKKALWRALHMAENVLTTHPQSLKHPESIQITDILNSIIEEKKYLNPKIEIEFQDQSKGCFINSEVAHKLERVICCILQNAIDALSHTHKPPVIHVSLLNRYAETHINIQDNANGIPMHVRKRLGFEKITYMKSGGKGLGLLMAVETIKELKGSLHIHSREKVGTLVSIRLPAK